MLGIESGKRGEVQTQLGHDPGAEILYEHICRANQMMHYRSAFRCSAVHREAEFAPMKFMGDVLPRVVIRVVATGGPLNANHPGPQIGQQPGSERDRPTRWWRRAP